METLYGIVANSTGVTLRSAREVLSRRGFNPDRRCRLKDVAKALLINNPLRHDSVFHGLDQRDVMHGVVIFFHRMIMEIFVDMRLAGSVKKIIDRRLVEILLQKTFRDRTTNKTYRVQYSVFSKKGMTAKDKIAMLFVLPHVLGHRALCLPEEVRLPILTALARIQLIIIAVRGTRAYNARELHEIFDVGYLRVFRALESVHTRNFDRTYRKKWQKHVRNPSQFPAPKKYRPCSRTWDPPHLVPETHTDETGDERAVGGYGKYRTLYNLTHNHFKEQVSVTIS